MLPMPDSATMGNGISKVIQASLKQITAADNYVIGANCYTDASWPTHNLVQAWLFSGKPC